jgi:hypothetical protein
MCGLHVWLVAATLDAGSLMHACTQNCIHALQAAVAYAYAHLVKALKAACFHMPLDAPCIAVLAALLSTDTALLHACAVCLRCLQGCYQCCHPANV